MPRTVCPSASRRCARWKPMKPAVPVTRKRMQAKSRLSLDCALPPRSTSADEIRCEARRDVVGNDLGGASLGVLHATQPGEALLPERVIGHSGGGRAAHHDLAG